MQTFKSLSYDLVKVILDMTEFKYTDLKDLTKGFPEGSYHRTDMEYRTETQRLLEERKEYYMNLVHQGCLLHVPINHINHEMCIKTVKIDGCLLLSVPEELRDREICLEAVKRGSSVGSPLEFVPGKLRGREMCLEAVKCGSHLGFVPDDLRDREMCLEAVKKRGYTLKYVPEELRDYEMCLTAVKQDGCALEYVPEELRDREMCMEAVKDYSCALEYVPEELRDEIRVELGL